MKKTKIIVGILILLACILTIADGFEASAGYSIYCSECGKMIDSGSKFCMYCGHRVNSYPSYSTGKRIIGYNMVHYGTQMAASPHYRMFRNYSINKAYSKYGARESYGEKHFTRYVDAYMLYYAKTYEPGMLINGDYAGYQKGTDTAYSFGDDKYVWFIDSPVYG